MWTKKGRIKHGKLLEKLRRMSAQWHEECREERIKRKKGKKHGKKGKDQGA
jgi:hypothetical protein